MTKDERHEEYGCRKTEGTYKCKYDGWKTIVKVAEKRKDDIE